VTNRVLITGCGIISSIGNNLKETYDSILSEKTGIGKIDILNTKHKDHLIVGEIKSTNEELAKMAGIELKDGITRTTLLGIIAANQAVSNAFSKPEKLNNLAFISGNTVGGMVTSELYYPDFLENDSKNAFIESHDCGDSTERIARQLGIKGFTTTINTACSSSANAIMLGARLIKSGKAKTVIAGGVDALSMFTLNGFNTLMIVDPKPCKPFDNGRNGLNLGEGAAYVVLESEKNANEKNVLCELNGYGNANDAYHQTALSPEGRGAVLSMNSALENSGLMPKEINYINAHGTATQNNDLSEGIAIEKIFGTDIPYLSSTKSMTGHTLGASGAIEAIISILAIQKGIVPANLNYKNKMEELIFTPTSNLVRDSEIKHVLSNSFGFGGNNTSLIFSKC